VCRSLGLVALPEVRLVPGLAGRRLFVTVPEVRLFVIGVVEPGLLVTRLVVVFVAGEITIGIGGFVKTVFAVPGFVTRLIVGEALRTVTQRRPRILGCLVGIGNAVPTQFLTPVFVALFDHSAPPKEWSSGSAEV
jgi:hypothetical protein